MKNTVWPKLKAAFWPALFIFSGVLAASFYCFLDGKTLLDLYLPAAKYSVFSDEPMYYKQIEALAGGSIPQGYFGYNNSHAACLTFGTWSVLCFLPYALVGSLLGWNLYMPIFCNLLFFTAALAFFYYCARPDKQQICFFVAVLLLSPSIVRFLISGMIETFFFSLILCLCGAYHLLKQGKTSKGILVFVYFLIFMCVTNRPYYILFYFLPYWYWRQRAPKAAAVTTTMMVILSLLFYFLYSALFSAPYPLSLGLIYSIKWFFRDGFFSGIINLFVDYLRTMKNIVLYAFSGLVSGEAESLIYLSWGVSLLALLFLLWKKRKRIVLYLLLCDYMLFSAIVFFYYHVMGARHTIAFYLFGILIICMEDDRTAKAIVTAGLAVFLLVVPKTSFLYNPSYYEAELAEQYEEQQKGFESVMVLNPGQRWDNTVAVIESDRNIIYFLPKGFAANPVRSTTDCDLSQISARYILTNAGSGTDVLLSEEQSTIWRSDSFALFQMY